MKQRPPPGFIARPTPFAAALVSIGVLAVPAESRDRYRDEFRAELCCLPTGRQLTEAAGLLSRALSLRSALKETTVSVATESHKPLACRLGRHHYRWVDDDNPEKRESRHAECPGCGKIKEVGGKYTPVDGGWMARGAGGGGL